MVKPGEALSRKRLWIVLAGCFVLYFLLARAFIWLAPGHALASPLYPATGVGMGAALVTPWGAVAAGVASVISNWLSLSDSGAGWEKSCGQALWIGCGVALQALAGRWALRRAGVYPGGLGDAKSVGLFMLIAGPLCCLISASWASAGLALSGSLDPDAVLSFWLTWWSGDALGAVAATPFALTLFANPTEEWRKRRVGLGVAMGLINLLAAVGLLQVNNLETGRLAKELSETSARLRERTNQSLADQSIGLEALSSFLISADRAGGLTKKSWEEFSAGIMRAFPSDFALGFAVKATGDSELAALRFRLGALGVEGFEAKSRVSEDGATGPWRGGPGWLAALASPQEKNKAAVGYDLTSTPLAKRAIDQLDRGESERVSEPLQLVQDPSGTPAMVVYRRVKTPLRAVGGAPALVYAAFKPDLVLERIRRDLPEGLQVCLSTLLSTGETRHFGEKGAPLACGAAQSAVESPMAKTAWVSYAGQAFQVTVLATPAYARSRREPESVVISVFAVVCAAALSALMLLATGRAAALSTERQALQLALDELRAARGELERKERVAALGRLVSGVSHEMGTPLGNALLLSGALRQKARVVREALDQGRLTKGGLDDFIGAASESSELLEESLERASSLMRSFKSVSVDQESGRRRDFDLKQALEEVALSVSPMLKNAGCSITVECEPGIKMSSYPGALAQIISNLAENALAHAYPERGGPICVSAREQDGWAVIEARDWGKGFSPDAINRAFEPFFTTRSGSGGSGLGLAITWRLAIEPLGGGMEIDGSCEIGSLLRLRAPLIAPERP